MAFHLVFIRVLVKETPEDTGESYLIDESFAHNRLRRKYAVQRHYGSSCVCWDLKIFKVELSAGSCSTVFLRHILRESLSTAREVTHQRPFASVYTFVHCHGRALGKLFPTNLRLELAYYLFIERTRSIHRICTASRRYGYGYVAVELEERRILCHNEGIGRIWLIKRKLVYCWWAGR